MKTLYSKRFKCLFITFFSTINICALAADYPIKPIKIIVGFAPGGATDAIARILAQDMAQTLSQPVIVENKLGATGNVATDFVRRAEPDGYTILLTSQSHITNPMLLKAVQYDAIKDFSPITQAAILPMMLVVGGETKWTHLKDLAATSKSSNESISYATAGIGGAGHLNAELLAQAIGSKMTHIPFKGSAPALAEVMSGRVTFQFTPIAGVNQFVATNKLRVLGIGTKTRHPEWPNISTMDELGYPGFDEAAPWLGVFAPKNTPIAVINALNQAAQKSLKETKTLEKMKVLGAIPSSGTPGQFITFLENDTRRWSKIITEAGLKPE